MVVFDSAAVAQDSLPQEVSDTQLGSPAYQRRSSLRTIWASVAAHLLLLLVSIVHVFSLAPNSDNLWQLNLVRQFRENPHFAVTFVDANRIFPDLIIATSLERAWSLTGASLSGRGFAICLITLNVALLFAVSMGVKRQFGNSASICVASLTVVMCLTSEYFLGMLRPGYHTTGSLLALNWVIWRFLRSDSLSVLDMLFLTALAFGSRLFLPLLLAPCFFTLLLTSKPKRRIRAASYIVPPSILAVVLWILLISAPNVSVYIFNQTLQISELRRLPIDFAKGTGIQDSRLFIDLPMFFWVITLCGVAMSIRTFRIRHRRTSPLVRLNVLFLFSLFLGSVSMRMVNYVIDGRIYVLMFPIFFGCVVTGSHFGITFDLRRSVGTRGNLPARLRRVARAAPVAVAAFVLFAGSSNSLALGAQPIPYWYDEVPALLKEAQLLDKPGLGTFWSAYSLGTAERGVTIRMINDNGQPMNWVNNPWEIFRVPGTKTIDPNLKYYWVLAMKEANLSGGSTTHRPTYEEVSKMFGKPTKVVTGSNQTKRGRPVLYVFEEGLDLTAFRREWVALLRNTGINTRNL